MPFEEVRVPLRNVGATLVLGENLDRFACNSNGVGKSTIVYGICYAIYGKTPLSGSSKDAKNLVRDGKEESDMEVELYLDVDDQSYRIQRGIGRIQLDSFSSENQEWRRISEGSATNAIIVDLLGISWDVFKSIIIFSEDTIKFARETDLGQKKILEAILNTEFLARCLKTTKDKLSSCDSNLNKQRARLEAVTHLLNSEMNLLFSSRKNIENKKQEIRKLREEMNISITRDKKRMSVIDREIEICKLKILQFNPEKLPRLKDDRKTLQRQQNSLSAESNQLNCSKAKQEQTVSLIEKKKKRLYDSQCPICFQKISEEYRSGIFKDLEEEKKSCSEAIENYIDIVQKNEKKYAELNREIQTISNIISEEEERIRGIRDAQNKIEDLNKEKERLQISNNSEESSIQRLEHIIKSDEDDLEIRSKNIQKIETDIQLLREEINRLEHKEKGLNIWKEAFSPTGLRSLMLDSIQPYLVERANYYADILFGGGATIEISTISHNRNGEAKDRFSVDLKLSGAAQCYQTASGGQKQRADLCIALALRDLAMNRSNLNINLMVFDEVFDKIDITGCEKVSSLITREASRFGTCFVISHLDSMKDMFDNKWTVRMENGSSKLLGV